VGDERLLSLELALLEVDRGFTRARLSEGLGLRAGAGS
jgi:hypothetical protein